MAYSRGKIKLTNVQGEVEITVHASLISAPAVNLFDKNDPDMLDTGRFNSSHVAVAYQEGQLVTGYIPCTNETNFTVTTDYANDKNGYTGQICLYDGSKKYKNTAVFSSTNWTWSADRKTGTLTIDHGWASADVAYIRFCLAYTDIDNITITKS